jgi:hypothetical protein
MFAEIVQQRDQPPSEKTKSPKPGAEPGTEAPAEQPQPEETVQENLEAENPEPETTENPEPEASEETDLSQPPQTGNAALDAVLKDLNPDAVKHFVEIANAVQSGETSIGQVKRQFKLGKEENAELAKLREENERLKAQPPAATAGQLPDSVAKLKTAAEVDAREAQAQDSIDAIENFLEENPQGGDIGNGQTFTRQQLVERKRALQQELRALPQQRKALEQSAQFERQQAEVTTATRRDFPQLNDPENPDTKLASDLVKGTPLLNAFPNRDYLALALAVGHRTLQADLNRRKAGPAGKPVQTQRPGTVPAKKPHTAAPAAAKPASVPAADLVKGVKDKDSLAALLSATGR